MNIFDFAMEMEKDGENYYRELASKTDDEKIRGIMNILADAEVKHHGMMHALKAGTPEMVNKYLADIPRLDQTRNLFEKIQKQSTDFKSEESAIELYRKAQELEKKSQAFYLEKSQETNSLPEQKLFKELADEEERHYQVLEKLIASLS